MIKKLMDRWKVDSLWQVVVILFIFSITGFSCLYVKKVAFGWLDITPETVWWIRTIFWLLIVLPAYQVLFLMYGFIFGQFDFVWKFEKRTFGKLFEVFGK